MTEVQTPRYDHYKDSGVDWIGDIPDSWVIAPGLVAFQENKRSNTGLKEKQVLSLSYGSIVIKPAEKLTGLVPESFETYQIVEPGDIIVRGTDLQNDKTSLRTGLASYHGIITSAYIGLRVGSRFSSAFLHYFLHSLDTSKALYQYGTGLRQNLAFDDFKRMPIIDIPLEDQNAIVAFLDEKTAKIDEAIAIKERQIALLKERKQIIIQNAVTKGLNPDAPMKDSGVDWIGQIPAHWEVKKAAHYFKAKKGADAARLTKEYCGTIAGEFPVYSGQTDNEGVLSEINSYEFDYTDNGCLLCSTVGAKAMTIRFLQSKFSLSQNCMIIVGRKPEQNMKFFSYAFEPIFTYFRNLIPDHMQASFRMEDFYEMRFLLPPENEQYQIGQFIQSTSQKIDQLALFNASQIQTFKEYKTTLINRAVTGKVKVT